MTLYDVNAVKPDAVERKMNVYFRNHNGKFGNFQVDLEEGEDHTDAILRVKEALVEDGEGYNEPVLAFIRGGKYYNKETK